MKSASDPTAERTAEPGKSLLKHWLCILLLAAAYLAAARIGLSLASLHNNVSPFWPATGMGIAICLLGGPRSWIAVALGAFAANAMLPGSLAAAFGIAAGNTLEGVLGAALYRQIVRASPLEPFSGVVAWTAVALAAPVVSASLGVGSLVVSGAAPGTLAGPLWTTWWSGDAIGAIVAGPALCAVWTSRRHFSIAYGLKAFPVLVAAVLVGQWVFYGGGAPFLFAVFPVVFLAVVLVGNTGALLTCLGLAGFSVFAAGNPSSPFAAGELNQTLLELEPFLFALAVTSLLLGVFRRERCLALPGLILLAGWTLSGWLFAALQEERRDLENLRLDGVIGDVQEAIQQRMTTYVDALHGGVSLFAASEGVERDEWRRYVETLNLAKRYPGINGVGTVFPVRTAGVDQFVAGIRADGRPQFRIHGVPGVRRPYPDPAGWQHFVITQIEPLEGNQAAIGLDLASEKRRMDAARIARDSGQPRITERITLIQDGLNRAGFLLFVPMYFPDQPVDTVHRRRLAFRGWVYAPFITENFLRGVLGNRDRQIELAFYGGLSATPDHLLFSTTSDVPSRFARTTVLQLAGQQFRLGWNPGPEFPPADRDPFANAASLALVPALLAAVVMSLQTVGRRAGALANERTQELQLANASLESEMKERRRAEDEARCAREAAEAANHAKSEFLATMSHEIRTPMNGVLGYADMLAESPLSAEQRQCLDTIRSSGRVLLTILNDILDLSKIEAGKFRLESIPFSPRQGADEVLALMDGQARQKALPLVLDIPGPLPGAVVGDPVRFKQILWNLVSNAIKFTESGSVRLSMTWRPEGAGGRLCVKVTDTGIGIPPEKQEELFEKFTQSDISTSRRFGGTGLGLSICKRLVELMDGKVEMRSTPGEGTSIAFELPLQTTERPADEPQTGAVTLEERGNRRRVLLADDTPLNRKLAQTILCKLGCDVEVAADGGEAVELATKNEYDIIYMDCQMPVVDGFAATKEIRRRLASRHVPIIAVTANAQDSDREKCLSSGMDDFISKPFSKRDFLRTLEAWCAPAPENGAQAGITVPDRC